MLEFEFHIVREFENFHYGWFVNLAVDFNKTKGVVRADPFFSSAFGNAVLSASEIGEIRNQVDYMLDAEDDADEEFIGYYEDPFASDEEDPFYEEDPFEVDLSDPFEIDDDDPFASADDDS